MWRKRSWNTLTNLLIPKDTVGWSQPVKPAVDKIAEQDFFAQSLFRKMLCLERGRAERSGRRLVLMVLEAQGGWTNRLGSLDKIQNALSDSTRQTDIKGWYEDGVSVGVIFTEIALAESSIVQILSRKVTQVLTSALGQHEFTKLKLSFHAFPDNPPGSGHSNGDPTDDLSVLYPDLAVEHKSRRLPLLVKRCLDIAGSLAALIVLSPVMAVIALAVKLSSPGPVLFRQVRLGQSGRGFTFLKFRSMKANCDPAIHEAYVKSFIANKAQGSAQSGNDKVFKMQSDPRITRVGKFIRRTSLDEVPQFFNVLAGHMSLVGPRPPLPYEFENYETWHRRRLLAMKPGITGYWQVEGRSRVKFDDMVRMDLAYARNWSLWNDLKILVKTPLAVFSGSGAC